VDSILLSTPYQGVKKICEQAGRAIRVIRAYPRLADTWVRGGEGAGEAEGYTVDVSCKTGSSLMSERWLYCVPKIAEEVDFLCKAGSSLLALEPKESHG
jgi:hypothetical protein